MADCTATATLGVYTKHLNMLNSQKNAIQERYRNQLVTLEKERINLIQAIKDGVPATMIKDDLEHVTLRKEEVSALLKTISSYYFRLWPHGFIKA